MLDAPQLSPTGKLILEVREDPDVAALVAGRIRPLEPAPGDAQPEGSFQAFIIIAPLSIPVGTRMPAAVSIFGTSCYGTTPENAWAVHAALVKAVHMRGPRTYGNGIGAYQSLMTEGGALDRDPDTKQPVVRGTLHLVATTQAVT